MEENILREKLDDYLISFQARNLHRCVAFFVKDSAIHLPWRTFRGLFAIEEWHKDRFSANLRVVRVEGITFDGEAAVINFVISSNRLKAFGLSSLAVRATLRFRGERVHEAQFGVRMGDASKEQGGEDAPAHRALVGPPQNYDVSSAMQFNLLTMLGLREHHYLLDVGCGSLRAGRLFIVYLLPGHYHGMDPDQWLIQEGINNEVGQDLIRIKQPVFNSDKDFTLSVLGRKFDFMLAHSIFTHASQAQIRKCLSEVKELLEQDGIFAATFVKGKENYSGDGWVYPGVCTYRPEFLKGMVEEAGMVCKRLNWPHPAGQNWLAIVQSGKKLATDKLRAFCRVYEWLGW